MSKRVNVLKISCVNGHRPRFLREDGSFLGLCGCGEPFGLLVVEQVDVDGSYEFIDLAKLRQKELGNE